MSIKLDQFHAAFFEESLEAVDDMEACLLEIEPSRVEADLVNKVFRAAHSLKGCSATFAFNQITEFVHVVETILDEMRRDVETVTQGKIDLLLRSMDLLRDMLLAKQDGTELSEQTICEVRQELNTIVAGVSIGSNVNRDKTGSVSIENEFILKNHWTIYFRPHREILTSGNDPIRMIGLLRDFGDVGVTTDVSGLPGLKEMNPEFCYLAWKIDVVGAATLGQLQEVFEWVKDESEIRYESHDDLEREGKTSTAFGLKNFNGEKSKDRKYDSASIRVAIDKVDNVINMVGELVITQSMLEQVGMELDEESCDAPVIAKLIAGLSQLERNTRELQENIMRIRMLPISHLFSRVPRIAHDLSKQLDKEIELHISGEHTELDKTLLEKLSDPLVHLIRNALDHGIEKPNDRIAAGKSRTGNVSLNAYHRGGSIVVEVSDDGAGLNKEKILKAAEKYLPGFNVDIQREDQVFDLIFQPGLSTADNVSSLSGRGVGMDVVRKNIQLLGGSIEVRSSQGKGTTFIIKLPLTLAILDGQLVKVGSAIYVIPLVAIVESLQIDPAKLNLVTGRLEMYLLRQEYIPVIRLGSVFNSTEVTGEFTRQLMVVVEADGQKTGLVVDDLLGQQQVVIKSLENNFKRVPGLSGATILGSGTVALIIDVSSLIQVSHNSNFSHTHSQEWKLAANSAAKEKHYESRTTSN